MTAFQGKERCSTLIEVRAIVIQDTEGARSLTYGTSALHGWQELNGTMATISQSGGQHILILFQNSHLRNGGGISAGRNRPLVQAHAAIRASLFVVSASSLIHSVPVLSASLPSSSHLSHTSPTPLPHLSTPPRPMTDHTKSFSSTVFNSLAPALITSAAPCPSAIDRSHPYFHSLFLLSPHLVPRSHATVGSRPRQFDRLPLRSYSF